MSTTLTGSDVGEPDGSDILWIWARVDLDDPARDDPVRVGLPFRGNVRTQALSHRTCESRIVRCDQMDDTMDDLKVAKMVEIMVEKRVATMAENLE